MDVHVGVLVHEALQHVRQAVTGEVDGHAQLQRACHLFPVNGYLAADSVHGIGSLPDIGQNALRHRGEQNSLAGADKQLAAQFFFQFLDTLGESGLGGEKPFRRLGDIPGFP